MTDYMYPQKTPAPTPHMYDANPNGLPECKVCCKDSDRKPCCEDGKCCPGKKECKQNMVYGWN